MKEDDAQGQNKEQVDQNLQDNQSLKDPKPDHPYMHVLGWGQAKAWTIFGINISNRFIYTGTAADWKKLLATLDSDRAVNKYLLPFFAAVGCGSGGIEHSYVDPEYCEGFRYKKATPSREDILELLKALYDTDQKTKSKVDLPNEMWFEGGSNIPEYYDAGFDGLAEFITKYQTLLIKEKSSGMPDKLTGEKKEGVALNYGDVKKLATEGTRWGDVMIDDPRVVQAMIDNAFATAIAAAKTVIRPDGINNENSAMENNLAINMVRNAALIINAAIDSYGDNVKTANTNISSIFDQVWGMVPLPGGVSQKASGIVKVALLKAIKSNVQIGGAYNDIKELKGDYIENYSNVLNETADGLLNLDVEVLYLSVLLESFISSIGN